MKITKSIAENGAVLAALSTKERGVLLALLDPPDGVWCDLWKWKPEDLVALEIQILRGYVERLRQGEDTHLKLTEKGKRWLREYMGL